MGEYLDYVEAKVKERPGIMVYFDTLDMLVDGEYSKEEAGELFFAILQYGRYGDITQFRDRGMKVMFKDLMYKIDRDGEKWAKETLGSVYGSYKKKTLKADPDAQVIDYEEWVEKELAAFHGSPMTGALPPMTGALPLEQEHEHERETETLNQENITTPAPAKTENEDRTRATDGRGDARGGDLSQYNAPADFAIRRRSSPRSIVDMFNIPTFQDPDDDPLA